MLLNSNLYGVLRCMGGILCINLFACVTCWEIVLVRPPRPISLSDLAITTKVPILCVSTAGASCPVHLTAAWWTAINPWWRGWGIFMCGFQQWHNTFWVWIICLPYTGSNCWVRSSAKWFACACVCAWVGVCVGSCVWFQGHSDALRGAAGDEFYMFHWHLKNLLPSHWGQCLSSLLNIMHGVLMCFISLSGLFYIL